MQQPPLFPLIWEADPDRLADRDHVFGDQTRCLWWSGVWTNMAELALQGGFSAISDAGEALGALHSRWGGSLPGRIDGCVSWVMWDGPKRELWMVRDRLGTGGLFWRRAGSRFEVADQIESLLPRRLEFDSVNRASVVSHLRGGAPPEGSTFHSEIHSVAPGEAVVFSETGVRQIRYWRPSLGSRPWGGGRESSERLWNLLVRVAGDYAVAGSGVALSGGLDSTSLAAALQASGRAPGLTAFVGVSPEVPESDESERARQVSRHLGLDWTEIPADVLHPLRDGFQTLKGSPHFFYYTRWWEALFERASQRGVGTVYTGGGGDHLFAGVSGYPDLLLTGRWPALFRRLLEHSRLQASGGLFLIRRKLLGPILYAYWPWWRRRCLPAPAWLGRGLRELDRETCQKAEAPTLALPGRVHRLRSLDSARIAQFCQDLNRRAADRGVQLRHPLLDHRLVEFALSLPAWESSQGGWDKMVLRNAVRQRLPVAVTTARRKVVPGPILRLAVQRRADLIEDLLTSMRCADLGWVEPEKLRRAVNGFRDGSINDSTFWFALTLEDWLRRHF